MTRARWIDLALLAGAFATGTLVTWLLGAANTAHAMTGGQIAFAATLVFVLLRR
jgi:hypothetical protein